MKAKLTLALFCAALGMLLGSSRAAFAQAGGGSGGSDGTAPDTSMSGAAGAAGAAGEPAMPPDMSADEVPLACDGALCDTTPGATMCSIGFAPDRAGAAAALGLGLACALVRRRANRTGSRTP